PRWKVRGLHEKFDPTVLQRTLCSFLPRSPANLPGSVIRKNCTAHTTCSISGALFGGRGGGCSDTVGLRYAAIASCFLLRFLFRFLLRFFVASDAAEGSCFTCILWTGASAASTSRPDSTRGDSAGSAGEVLAGASSASARATGVTRIAGSFSRLERRAYQYPS